jgi:hypothetical protein
MSKIMSRPASQLYRDNYDKIFGVKKEPINNNLDINKNKVHIEQSKAIFKLLKSEEQNEKKKK